MKIETYFEALQISEALKKLNLDITQMDPQTRVKIKDGVVMFEPEKECFVSKRTEGHQCPLVNEEPIKYDAGPQPEQLEYYYFKESELFTIQEGDESLENKKWYKFDKSSFGYRCQPTSSNVYRRKIQNHIEEPEYHYLKETDIIQKRDECSSNGGETWSEISNRVVGTIAKCYPNYIFRRKIQKNPTS